MLVIAGNSQATTSSLYLRFSFFLELVYISEVWYLISNNERYLCEYGFLIPLQFSII